MHTHRIAHLDISLRNVLTDYQGRYNYIDFEMSRRYDNVNLNRYPPRIVGYRGTEIPPEVERGEESDPFKIDIWALAVLILRASKVCLSLLHLHWIWIRFLSSMIVASFSGSGYFD